MRKFVVNSDGEATVVEATPAAPMRGRGYPSSKDEAIRLRALEAAQVQYGSVTWTVEQTIARAKAFERYLRSGS